MAITEFLAGSGKLHNHGRGDTIMKKIAVIFALAFALTTGMAVVTVVAHTDLAMADGAPVAVMYPEQVSACDDGTAC
jgi:hypothetical protein